MAASSALQQAVRIVRYPEDLPRTEDFALAEAAARQAFVDSMHGDNRSKLLVRVSGDPVAGRADW